MNRIVLNDPRRGPQREVAVWMHTPARYDPASPIVIVMHGLSRDAGAYLEAWRPCAEQHGFAVAAPEFATAQYPAVHDYNYGNMVSPAGALLPRSEWLFPVIDSVFDAVRAALGSTRQTYCLYGHSAGGQFVHRLATFAWSSRIELAISANAGSYTLPTFDAAYPFGLAGTAFAETDFPALFQRPLIVMLGDRDTDSEHRNLPRQPEALRQGPHRFSRGHYYMAAAERAARERDLPLAWRSVVAPGVAHSNPGMALVAAGLCADASRAGPR